MYLLSEVIPWRRRQDRAEVRQTPKIDDEQARKAAADADIAEMKRDIMRGELARTTDSERIWERTLSVCRSRITAARGKWAPKALGLGTMAEASAFMDALIEDVLASLRDGADEIETTDDGAEEAA